MGLGGRLLRADFPADAKGDATMVQWRSKDPLHGLTLESILTSLVDEYGWEWLAKRVKVRCFMFEPSITSSLKFLRRTPWARTEVEDLYLKSKGLRRPAPKG